METLDKKSVELVHITRSTLLGSRIAHPIETSNAESPTPMYITNHC